MNWRALLLIVTASISCALAQTHPASTPAPNLAGVYQIIASGTTLPGGLKNQGLPAGLVLRPSAAQETKKAWISNRTQRKCALRQAPFA